MIKSRHLFKKMDDIAKEWPTPSGPPKNEFEFDAGGHMIRSEHMKSCLTAQIRFLLFKGPGSFKKSRKFAEM